MFKILFIFLYVIVYAKMLILLSVFNVFWKQRPLPRCNPIAKMMISLSVFNDFWKQRPILQVLQLAEMLILLEVF